MSTNATIAVKTEKGFKYNTVHWDGYPEHVGKQLVKHYNTTEKALDAIKSQIRAFEKDGSIEYFTADKDPRPVVEVEELSFDDLGCEYVYIFTEGEWFVDEGDGGVVSVKDYLEEN